MASRTISPLEKRSQKTDQVNLSCVMQWNFSALCFDILAWRIITNRFRGVYAAILQEDCMMVQTV